MKVQAIRFDAKRFTVAQAKKWLSDNNYTPMLFEPASGTKELAMPDEEVKEVVVEKCEMPTGLTYVPMGVTSFADLAAVEATEEATDEVHELASQFQGIVNNIMADPMLDDKAGAVKNVAAEFATLVDQAMSGAEESKENEEAVTAEPSIVKATWTTKRINDFPDSSFLYVEDGQKDNSGKTLPRSKRHFPVKDENGKVDLPHLRNAIARIPQSNAPGLSAEKKAALQEQARKMLANANKESGWLSEALSAVGEFFGLKPKEAPAPSPAPDPGLMLWKEGGRYRWLAVFSNKYRDDDNPPEILASAAHKEFVGAVESGAWPYPELRHFHVKGTKWGSADWLHYDEATGFNLASGWVDAGHEKEAEALAALIDSGEVIRVSHGMPTKEIQRDPADPTVITRYRSIEISDLPGWAAANRLTGFEIKEGDMPIPDVKKDYLKKAGLSDEEIARIEADLEGKAKEAEHLESKDATPPAEAAPVEPPAPEAPAPAPDAPITREEIVAAIQAAVGPLAVDLAELQAGLKEAKEAREVEIKDIAAATPAFSLVEMLKGGGRAVGADEARIKGRKPAGPKETKPKDDEPIVGIPFISQLLQSGGKQPEN